MTIKNTSIALIGILSLSSCATIISREKMTTRTNKTVAINVPPLICAPIMVDLDIDMTKRAKGTSSGILTASLNEEYFRELALAQAIISSDSDLLLEPIYQVTKTPVPGKSTTSIDVIVTGYGAKFANPKKLTIADTSLIQFSLKHLNENTPVKTTEMPNNAIPTATKAKRNGLLIY